MLSLKPDDISKLKTYNYIVSLQDRVIQVKNDAIQLVYTLLFRVLFGLTLLLFISGLSIFLVFLVQYQMLPVMHHSFPVHLQHSDCEKEGLNCGYPTATISFLQGKTGKEGPLLMAGQKYSMWLELDLPESEVVERNSDVGTFMTRIDLRSWDRMASRAKTPKTTYTSSRSAILQYRSRFHQTLRILFLFPLYVTGYLEERQKLKITLIPSYQEDPFSPITEAVIELEKAAIDVYKSNLIVEAHLEGARYYMQKYPVIIGSFFACFNFMCGVLLASFSAYNRFARREAQKAKALATAPEESGSDVGDDVSLPDGFDPLESIEDDSDDNFQALKIKSSSFGKKAN